VLTPYERTEVEEFEEVWYLATKEKKYQASKLERLINNGFDDEEGYYRLKAGDQIGYRYEIKKQDTPQNNPKDDSQSKS
jgi:dual specificity tyrosine-phosphorylation-regulated kinase 2/3/4